MNLFGVRAFESAAQRDVYQGAIYLFILTEVFILFLSGRNSRGAKTKADRGSRIIIVLGVWAVMFFSFGNPFFKTIPEPFYYLGTALLIFGIVLRCWSVWTLRRYFTLSVQTTGEQKLIRNGPYRVIRHPAYTGSILQLAGMALGMRSWAGFLAAVAVSASVYGYRIHTEEKALQNRFGEKYEEYRKSTWRLFPLVF